MVSSGIPLGRSITSIRTVSSFRPISLDSDAMVTESSTKEIAGSLGRDDGGRTMQGAPSEKELVQSEDRRNERTMATPEQQIAFL